MSNVRKCQPHPHGSYRAQRCDTSSYVWYGPSSQAQGDVSVLKEFLARLATTRSTFFLIKLLGFDVRHHRPFVLMSGADARLPISRAKSLPSLGDPKRGPSFSQAPRFGRPVSAARASSQPREPASPLGRPSQGKTGRGYKDQQRPAAPAAPAAEFKEWKAVPVTELLPSEVSKAIRRIASQTGGGVVIEMQWGSSAYLPAHNGGQKYRDCAQRLQQLISGRLSRGSPLPVHIVDKPIRFSKRCSHSLIREQPFRGFAFFRFWLFLAVKPRASVIGSIRLL